MRVGDELQTLSGALVRIDDIQVERGNFPVFNFAVGGTHTYYAESVLVHNCNGFVRGAGKAALGNEFGAVARGYTDAAVENAHFFGKVQFVSSRKTLKGEKAIRIIQKDGRVLGINSKRVKEFLPNTHPRAWNYPEKMDTCLMEG